MAYIGATGTSAVPAPCVFCDCLARDDDRAALILLRAPLAFLILNAYPYASGHLMAVVNRHVGTLAEATEEELAELMGLVVRGTALLTAEYRAEGFNIGLNQGRIAGAGVEGHLHMHVVPRWGGDNNFMSTIGEVRVLPEALSATWERLKKRLDA
jgi:ATP adenylyltransferase